MGNNLYYPPYTIRKKRKEIVVRISYTFDNNRLLYNGEPVVLIHLDANNIVTFEYLNEEDKGAGIVNYLLYCLRYHLHDKGLKYFVYEGATYTTKDYIYYDERLDIDINGTNYMYCGTLHTMVHSSEKKVQINRVRRLNEELKNSK